MPFQKNVLMFRKIKKQEEKKISFYFENEKINAYEGETIASALLRSGIVSFRKDLDKKPRGPFCMMGTCFECLVNVDNFESQQACQFLVKQNISVKIHKTKNVK